MASPGYVLVFLRKQAYANERRWVRLRHDVEKSPRRLMAAAPFYQGGE